MFPVIRFSFAQRFIATAAICALTLLLLAGCVQSTTISYSYDSETGSTLTVSHKWSTEAAMVTDFRTAASAGYTIIASAPASVFSLNTNIPAQSTFTAVTDNWDTHLPLQ